MKPQYLLLFILFISCSKPKAPRPVTTVYLLHSHVRYAGTDTLQFADIYLPDSGYAENSKVIIMVHGGGWNGGHITDFDGIGLYPFFTAHGYAVVNMSYRLCPQYLYPAPMYDIDSMIAYLQTKANEWHLDLTHICLVGKSAGAHLVMQYAYAYNAEHRIKAVIEAFGPTDLTDSSVIKSNIYSDLTRFFDANITQNAALWQEASPIRHMSTAVPTVILQGDADTTVHPIQGQLLDDSLSSRGISHLYYRWPNIGHGWDLNSWYADTARVVPWLNAQMQ